MLNSLPVPIALFLLPLFLSAPFICSLLSSLVLLLFSGVVFLLTNRTRLASSRMYIVRSPLQFRYCCFLRALLVECENHSVIYRYYCCGVSVVPGPSHATVVRFVLAQSPATCNHLNFVVCLSHSPLSSSCFNTFLLDVTHPQSFMQINNYYEEPITKKGNNFPFYSLSF